MDNDYGIVCGDDAVRFAEALAYAARMASKFELLGRRVDERRAPVPYRLGGEPCVYDDTEGDVVHMRDVVTVYDEDGYTSWTGELMGVDYGYDGFIESVRISQNDGTQSLRLLSSGVFYREGGGE